MKTLDKNFKNLKKAQDARRQAIAEGTIVTKSIRSEIIALIDSGASTPEIAMLLNLSDSQIERVRKSLTREKTAEKIAESVQYRQVRTGGKGQELANTAHPILVKLLGRMEQLVKDESDISKISTAIKVLHQLTQSAETKEEITQTLTRLRGK